jgi:hypothetical protein
MNAVLPVLIEVLLYDPNLGLLNKSKSFNRRGRKGNTQSSQRAEFMCFSFAFFATSLRSLRLKRTFSTIPPALAGEGVTNIYCYYFPEL